jgi:hypothetical protein
MFQMSGFDLNAICTEDDYINDMEPQFYTRAAPTEMVEEFPDSMDHGQESS